MASNGYEQHLAAEWDRRGRENDAVARRIEECGECRGEGWLNSWSGGEPDPYPCVCNPGMVTL